MTGCISYRMPIAGLLLHNRCNSSNEGSWTSEKKRSPSGKEDWIRWGVRVRDRARVAFKQSRHKRIHTLFEESSSRNFAKNSRVLASIRVSFLSFFPRGKKGFSISSIRWTDEPSNGKKGIERTTTAAGVLRGSIGTTTAVYTHSRMGRIQKGKKEKRTGLQGSEPWRILKQNWFFIEFIDQS